MTRMERIIRAVNLKYPGEISSDVAKHLKEMDRYHEYFFDDNIIEPKSSRNDAKLDEDFDPSMVMNREKRKQIILKLIDYQKSHNLSFYSLSKIMDKKTGHRVSASNIRNWITFQHPPNEHSTRIIQKLLDSVERNLISSAAGRSDSNE